MSEAESPAIEAASEVTSTQETAPTADAPPAVAEAPSNNAAAKAEEAHRRRIIEAAKIERRTLAKQREAEEREAKIAAREKEIEEKYSKASAWEKAQAEARRNPLGFLESTGLTLDDLVRAKLSDGQDIDPRLLVQDAETKSAAEAKAIREELERVKKTLEERDARERDERIQHATRAIISDIEGVVNANPDKYELILALEQQGEVLELMRGAYAQSQGRKVLSAAEAADMIEDYLFKQAEKVAAAKKVAARFAATSQPAAPQVAKATPQAKTLSDARAKTASVTTLTNSAVTSPVTPDDASPPQLSREEFIAKAANTLRAQRMAKESARAAKK